MPGLDAVAPPLMGAMRLPVQVFALLDRVGSLLWAGVPVGLGYFFAAQVDVVLAALASAGTFALELVLGLAALYILRKWWRRRSLLVALRMARITVEELHRAITDGRAPVVVMSAPGHRAASIGGSFPERCFSSSIVSTRRCVTSRSTRSW